MAGLPYRSPTPSPDGPPPDPLERLGGLRSSHRAPPLRRALAFPAAAAAIFATVVPIAGLRSAPSAAPFLFFGLSGAAAMFLIAAWRPLRDRGLRVDLHARGLVLARPGSSTIVHFDDVDEVWYELDRSSTAAGDVARVFALRLVDRAGATHRLPLGVDDPLGVLRWVLRNCSTPLLDEAQKALAAGEALTFARVTLDAERVRVGRASAAWRDLRLVRMQPGRVSFFGRLPLVPWRVVGLADVPHPTVFTRLVMRLAPRVEVDDPLGLHEDA